MALISSLARRMWAIWLAAPMFTLIFASSSTTWTSKRPPLRPRFFDSDRSSPERLEKSFDPSWSLKAPRMRSEYSQTGSCGGVCFMSMNSGVMAARIVGSEAMSSRSSAMELRAKYSACVPSRAAVAAANSAPASSWNSASMTIMIAMAPSTMMSATPRSRFLRRARAAALPGKELPALIAAGSRTTGVAASG